MKTALTISGALRKIALKDGDTLVVESPQAIELCDHAFMVEQIKRFGEARGVKIGAIILDKGAKLRAVLRGQSPKGDE